MFNQLSTQTDRDALFYPPGAPPERVPLTDLALEDRRVIYFHRDNSGDAEIVVVDPTLSTNRWPLYQQIVYHSPTGLEFGYIGSGPADTALNVLALILTPREAVRLHVRFKAEVISRISHDNGGELRLADVRRWVADRYAAELNDPQRIADEAGLRAMLADTSDAVIANAAGE